MGCDVFIIRYHREELKANLPLLEGPGPWNISFRDYVAHWNSFARRTGTWDEVNADRVFNKIRTDALTLERKEIEELYYWTGHPDFSGPGAEGGAKRIGLHVLEAFQDNRRVFLFPFGDFLHEYYHDFEQEERETCILRGEEFSKLMDYHITLNATILLLDEPQETPDAELLNWSRRGAADDRLMEIVTKNAQAFIDSKVIEEKVYHNTAGKVIERVNEEMYTALMPGGCGIGDIEMVLWRCLELRDVRLGPEERILILDSQ